MRTLTAVLLSLFALPLFADTQLGHGFSYHGAPVPPGSKVITEPSIYNYGEEDARNVVVRIEGPPNSTARLTNNPEGWNCSADGPVVTCTRDVLPMDHGTIFYYETLTANDDAGGRFAVTLTAHADNAAETKGSVPLIVFRRFHVTTTDDSGAGSFRQVLETINAECRTECMVAFDVPQGSVFEPRTPLPTLTACSLVWLNGGREVEGDRPFELAGTHLTSGSGLDVRTNCRNETPGSLVLDGFAINRFPQDGIRIEATEAYHASFIDLYVGTDRSGLIARPNGSRGIVLASHGGFMSLWRSVLSGNARSGLYVSQGFVDLSDVKIGVGADGRPLGNGASGIFVARGGLRAYRTPIAYNAHFGVSYARGASGIVFETNSIHSNGNLGVDYGLDGRTPDTEPLDVVNAPVITSAQYNANTNETIVRGTITINRFLGEQYAFAVYSNDARDAKGEAEGEKFEGARYVYHRDPGVLHFEVPIQGDLRGRIVTAVAAVGRWADYLLDRSSEFSEGVLVE